ncbi:MAG: glycosyltransferase family 2 protein [Bacillota bacterium]|nr:glycosyltransferase family 2 protein [Bacillota bacterium]
MKEIVYSVIAPACNEEEGIEEFYRRVKDVMDAAGEEYELVFVNDGSRDSTIDKLLKIQSRDRRVVVLDFSRNFGHQIAVTAGIEHARGRAVVVIDADLQDPPEVIPQMIEMWKQGCEVVYGKRVKRKGESAFKRMTAFLFYRVLNVLSGQKIPKDAGDFRLLDRKVCEAMKTLREHGRFLRGMVNWVGFRQAKVEYVRDPRFAGETKYTMKKMMRLAGDGIVGFSARPLKIALPAGLAVCFLALLYLIAMIILTCVLTPPPTYLHFVLAAILGVLGLVLCALGIMGIYMGRIFDEVQNRPLYILRGKYGGENGG